MFEFIRRALRGEAGAYIQALVVSLLLAGLVYTVVFNTGCSDEEEEPVPIRTCPETDRLSRTRSDFQVRLQANAPQARPGERATRTLKGQGDPGTSKVTYSWTPPAGATNLSFNPAPDVDGPPALWLDLSPDKEINISYNQPSLPPGERASLAIDVAVAEWDGQSSITSFTTLITNESLRVTAPRSRATLAPRSPAAEAELWEIRQWTDQGGITLTTDLCRDWFDLLQSDDTFLALRAPVSPTTNITEGYPLPIVFGGSYSNTLQLFDYDTFSPVISAPVEVRPERFGFLENSLPSAPGEHWLALGLTSEPIICPAGLEIGPDRWGFKAIGYLDLAHQVDSCQGCVLPVYYCYEGQEAPSIPGTKGGTVAAAVAQVLARTLGVTSYQGEGITCFGPQAVPLKDDAPQWQLGGATAVWVTPTQTITLYHSIHLDYNTDPMTFTLDHAGTLGVEWHLYDGDSIDPDLDAPLTLPITATREEPRYLWFISEPIPGQTASGAHTFFITATSTMAPYESLWTSDQVWVGGWVIPPLEPSPGHRYRVYLPLVIKSR